MGLGAVAEGEVGQAEVEGLGLGPEHCDFGSWTNYAWLLDWA